LYKIKRHRKAPFSAVWYFTGFPTILTDLPCNFGENRPW